MLLVKGVLANENLSQHRHNTDKMVSKEHKNETNSIDLILFNR